MNGYTTVTVKNEIYKAIEELARRWGTSKTKAVEKAILDAKKHTGSDTTVQDLIREKMIPYTTEDLESTKKRPIKDLDIGKAYTDRIY
jgi:hypothetical protein